MISSRQKRPLERASASRDAKLIIIATEGEKTEKIYFTIFHSTKVKIIVIPSTGGRSAPAHIMQNMSDFTQKYELAGDDELWLVIDRDKWKPGAFSSIASSCRSKKINLAVSNPCFELWLSYHFDEDLPDNISSCTLDSHLKNIVGGYNKSKYDPSIFFPRIGIAVKNAAKSDSKPNARWPHPVGSRVYKLVRSIIESK